MALKEAFGAAFNLLFISPSKAAFAKLAVKGRCLNLIPSLEAAERFAETRFEAAGQRFQINRTKAMQEVMSLSQQQNSLVELHRSQGQLQAIFNNAAVGISLVDLEGNYVEVNDRWAEMLGYEPKEIYQILHIAITHPADLELSLLKHQELVQGKVNKYHIEKRFVCKDGNTLWVDLFATTIRNDAGQIEHIVRIITDITERVQAEAELRARVADLEQYNREITSLNEMADHLQICSIAEEMYQVALESLAKLFPAQTGMIYIFGSEPDEMATVATWGNFPPKEVCLLEDCRELCQKQFQCNPLPRLQCLHQFEVENKGILCVPLSVQRELLGLLHLYGIPTDSSKLWKRCENLAVMVADHLALSLANLRLRDQLHTQSIHDALTGLFNRRYLDAMLQREILQAQRQKYSFGLVMLDIDHFKAFNDVHGHEGGDALLRAFGTFLQKQIREGDIACRYGGEEFSLILPTASLEHTYQRAEQLRLKIKDLCVYYKEQPLPIVTASFGVAAFPNHGETVEALLRAADAALYRAKNQGRDRVCVM